MVKTQSLNTNKDLLSAIYEQGIVQLEAITTLQGDMSGVKKQVEYTNGKVAGLMEDKIRRDERAKVLAENPPQPPTQITAQNVTVRRMDPEALNKALFGIGAVATAIAGVIAYAVGGK